MLQRTLCLGKPHPRSLPEAMHIAGAYLRE
jgi:hypothetical protein